MVRVAPGTTERCDRNLRAWGLEPAWVQILALFLTGCVTMTGDLVALGLCFLVCKMKIVKCLPHRLL